MIFSGDIHKNAREYKQRSTIRSVVDSPAKIGEGVRSAATATEVFQCSTSSRQHIGAPAKAVDQSQQCGGCGGGKLERGGAAGVGQRGWGNEGGATRVRRRGRGSKGAGGAVNVRR